MNTASPIALHTVQLTTPAIWQAYEAGIGNLLHLHRQILLGDSHGRSAPECREHLLSNTATCMPYVWAIADKAGNVNALCTLANIEAGRHAFMHGVIHPRMRRHPLVTVLGSTILRFAFEELNLLKVKAEFEANNLPGKGFCLRMGFTREAYFKQDIRINGQVQDVVIYSLFASRFKQLWPKPEAKQPTEASPDSIPRTRPPHSPAKSVTVSSEAKMPPQHVIRETHWHG